MSKAEEIKEASKIKDATKRMKRVKEIIEKYNAIQNKLRKKHDKEGR